MEKSSLCRTHMKLKCQISATYRVSEHEEDMGTQKPVCTLSVNNIPKYGKLTRLVINDMRCHQIATSQ